MTFLTAASDRSSSGLSGAVSAAGFSGASSSGGLALMLLAMSLQHALRPRRIAVLRATDSLKGRLRLPKSFIAEESFDFRRKCARKSLSFAGISGRGAADSRASATPKLIAQRRTAARARMFVLMTEDQPALAKIVARPLDAPTTDGQSPDAVCRLP